MNTHSLKLLFLLICALMFAGCNNDIFIDDSSPSDSDFKIQAGGEKEVSFSTDYLYSVKLELSSLDYDWTTYADNDYSNTYHSRSSLYIMDQASSLPFLNRVEAVNDMVQVEFVQEKAGRLKIRLLGNTSGENISGQIRLVYSYKETSIRFTLMREEEAGGYIITGLTYGEGCSNDFRDSKRTLLTVRNNGDTPVTQTLCPADYCGISVKFTTEALSRFELDPAQDYPEVEIPTYVYRESVNWISGGFHGTTVRYSPDVIAMKPLDSGLINGKSFYDTYPVEIVPHSATAFDLSLSYILMTAKGTLHIYNPVTGSKRDLPTVVQVLQPYLFNFQWQNVPINEQ